MTRTAAKTRRKRVSKPQKSTKIAPSVTSAWGTPPPRADGTEEGINLSQINEHVRCPFRWHLKNRRLIDRRSVAPSMDLGSAIHAGVAGAIHAFAEFSKPKLTATNRTVILQATVKEIRTWRQTWIDEHLGDQNLSDDLDTQLTELQYKANDIATRALEELDLERWEVIRLKGTPLVEQKIRIPFLPGIPFYGTPDVVWKDRQKGGNWVADWKCRQSLQSVEHEEVDLQLPAYQYMLGTLGIPTTGSIKFQIRAETPKEPELNKNGAMSVQRIATTWEVYRAALIRNGLDPAKYQEMRQKLDVEFFRLDQLYRNQFEIVSFWDNIIAPLGQQLVEAKGFIRHMHYLNCSGCWARMLCLAELRGEDPAFLLETEYIDLKSPKAKLVLRPEDFSFVED